MGLGDVGDALSPTEEGMIRLGESPFDLQYAQPDLNLGDLGGDPTFQPGPLEQPSTTSPSTSVQLPEGTIYGETSPQDLGLSPTEEGMIQLGENPFDLNYAQPDLNLGDLGDITGNLAGDLETSFNAGDLSVPAGEVPQTPAASDTGGIGDIADSLTESGGINLGGIDPVGALGAGAGIAGAILSDRPIEQKAAASAVSAGQVAAPAIAEAVGGAAAGAVAGTVASGVGTAYSLAQLGLTLSKKDDPNATEAERIALNRRRTRPLRMRRRRSSASAASCWPEVRPAARSGPCLVLGWPSTRSPGCSTGKPKVPRRGPTGPITRAS